MKWNDNVSCEKCGGYVRRRVLFVERLGQKRMVAQPYCPSCGVFKLYDVDMEFVDAVNHKKRGFMIIKTGIELGHIVKKNGELVQRS